MVTHTMDMCELQVYIDKADSVEEWLGKRVVLDLVRQLQGKKYHLYFYTFSSVSLLTTL